MKKFIVVDDELLVRVGIRSLADWEDYGYSLAGEAVNGDEAFAMVNDVKPDFILTDLVMPESDGFSLIERVRSTGINVGIIVLSCHNDFENMREAMRRGADDYVFKPTLNRKELLEVFGRICGKISGKEGNDPSAVEIPPHESRRNEPADFHAAFSRAKKPFRILVVSFVGVEGSVDILSELRRQDPSILAVTVEKSAAFFVLENGGRQSLSSSFDWVREYARRYLGCGVFGAVSALVAEDGQIDAAVNDAVSLLRTACYGPGKMLVFADEATRTAAEFKRDKYAQACGELSWAIDIADLQKIREALTAIAATLRLPMDVGQIRRLLGDALVSFRIRGCAIGFGTESEASPEPLSDIIRFSQNLDDAIEKIGAYAESFVQCAKRQLVVRAEISAVCRWVLNDLSATFTVEAAAEIAGMSSSHFIHVFKDEMGMSFIDFVNQSRMKRARDLLLTTSLLVKEISDRVGYGNVNYFCNLFKKYFAMTPHDIREGKVLPD